MKQAGRISLVLLVTIFAVVIGLGVLFFLTSSESPETVGTRFLSDLAKGDADGLTKLTYMDGMTPEQIHKEWEYSVQAGKYYHFAWNVTGAQIADENTAALKIQLEKNSNAKGAYFDAFEVPLLRKDGHWLVDVRGMDHSFYPAFPR